MTAMQYVFLAYGVSFILLGGYAIILWLGLRRAGRRSAAASLR